MGSADDSTESVGDSAAQPRPSSRLTAALVAAGLAGTALASGVALAGGYGDHDGLVATARGLAVLIPVAVGLHQWRHGSGGRYPALLVLIGLVTALVALGESHTPWVYSTGRVAGWAAEALLIVLLLVFPTGVFAHRRDRRIAAAMGLILVGLYLPTALMAEDYATPAAASTCVRDCPANAFALVESQPAFVTDAIIPLRETATVLLMLVVAAVMAGRLRSASHLARRTLAPGLAVAAAHAVALAAFFGLRGADADQAITVPLSWLVFLSIPGLALAVAMAEVRRRQYVATALERLALGLPSHATAASLRRGMAISLEDPTLQIVYLVDGDRWVDESGWPVAPPAGEAGTVTEIRAGGRRVGAIVHDPWLAEDPRLLEAAASYALVVLENERLVTDLRSSLGELAESRTRVVAVADRERRRIERDLHDGAQQHLVGLRIQLELAAERLRRIVPRESDALMELGGSVEATIDEVRGIARGVFPALLAEMGLEEALRSAARRLPVATGVSARGVSRWSPEIEATVYFACVEALQNAIKHADGASQIAIVLEGIDGHLHFEVSDDGSGFDEIGANGANGAGHGSGLMNMRDRVGAIGGELTIVSSPGHGTRVIGSVPTG